MPTLNLRSHISNTLRAACPEPRRPLKASHALMLLAFASSAGAQQQAASASAPPAGEPVEEVIVTGIRHAIETAIEVKKDADVIVEAVSAEDIGKLPDNSIADAIARLPGLAAQRVDGRAQEISIRGLSGDFSTALLNGHELVSTNNNRSVEFDQYPAELLSGVVVYKTPQAGLVAQGIGGTVDLQTQRPLEFGHRSLVASARAEQDQLGSLNPDVSDRGYRITLAYIDQFWDNTLGITVGYARSRSPTQGEYTQAWGYPSDNNNNLILGGARILAVSNTLTRDAVLGTIEFKPSSNYTSTLDMFYSKFSNVQLYRGLELPLWWGGLSPVPGSETISDSFVTQATFDGVKAVVRNDLNRRDATVPAFAWNNKLTTGAWTEVADVSYSSAHRKDEILEEYGGTGRAGQGATDDLTYRLAGPAGITYASNLNYADPATIFITSPQGWGSSAALPGGQDGYINSPETHDALWAFKLSASRALGGPFSSVDVGVNYASRHKTFSDRNQGFLALQNNPANLPMPNPFVTSLAFAGIPGVLSYDPQAAIANGLFKYVANADSGVATESWDLREKVTTLYGKLNIATQWGPIPLTGNFGVQAVKADQTSSGIAGTGNPATNLTPSEGGANYTLVLPTLNLAWDLPEDQKIRLALGRQMARPRPDDMSASLNYSFCTTVQCQASTSLIQNPAWSGSGGNPTLHPWIADALDLSYEKYLAHKAYFSFTVFSKNLRTFIYQRSLLYNFSYIPTPGYTPAETQGFVTEWYNGNGGRIDGIETALSMPLSILSDKLDGFGITVGYAANESNVFINGANTTVPGLSKQVWNATFYYEKNGWQVRFADRYRSSFEGNIVGFGAGINQQLVGGESIMDAQVGYTFDEGPLKGLSILFQANNLFDEPYRDFTNNDMRQFVNYQRFGRVWLLGATYKID